MKKVLVLFVAVIVAFASLDAAHMEANTVDGPYFTDVFTVDEQDGNRTAYEFIADKHLLVSSPASGKVKVVIDATTNETMQKLGFTSLKVQRWNGSSWETDEEETNQFSYSTDTFSYTHTFTGLYSGYQYRVRVTLRARRVPGEVQDVTITSDSIICH